MGDPARTGEADASADGGSPPGVPRWVKVAAVVTGILAVVVVTVLLLTGGDHGPGHHSLGTGISSGVQGLAGAPG